MHHIKFKTNKAPFYSIKHEREVPYVCIVIYEWKFLKWLAFRDLKNNIFKNKAGI